MEKGLINKIKILLFSIRDALSFSVIGVPIKLGEIYASCEIIGSVGKKGTRRIANKHVQNILLLLLLYFFFSIIVSLIHYNSIQHTFFLKYTLKNLFYIIFIYCIAKYSFKNNSSFFKSLFKGIVLIQIIFAILLYGFHRQFVGLSLVPPSQYISIGSVAIPRFVGSASEPAFIVPVLAIPFFYFLVTKNNKLWFFISLIMLFLTFSPFAIGVIILGFFSLIVIRYRKNALKIFIILFCSLFLLVVLYSITQLFAFGKQINSMINKAVGFVSFGAKGKIDWSATDRLQHINYSFELIREASPFQLIFGRGTGTYYYAALNNTNLLVNDVEEAYNLYLSTVVDRGIMGLVLLLAIIYNSFRICKTDRNPAIMTLKFGMFVQFVQFLLVGNLWLYFLWIEIGFLISYDNYARRKPNEDIIYNK